MNFAGVDERITIADTWKVSVLGCEVTVTRHWSVNDHVKRSHT